MNTEYNKKTNYKSQLEEEYEDSFWRLIIHEYAEKEGEELIREAEEARNDPQYAPSPEAARRFNKMVNKYFRERKFRAVTNKASKIIKAAGIIVLVFVTMFTVAFISVDAFRVQILNFLVTFENKYTSVKLDESEPFENITAGLSDTYAPSYIPKGYKIVEIWDMMSIKTIKYINSEEKDITFMEFDSTGNYNIDTENAEIRKSIKINETEGVFVLKDEKTTVSWTQNDKIFVITAQISEEEIVRIAESIIFIK